MSKENQKTENHEVLARELFNWASDAHSIAEPEELKEDLDFMFRGFLESSYANESKNRSSIIVLRDHFNSLFDVLNRHNHQDFRDLDLLNLKLGLNVS